MKSLRLDLATFAGLGLGLIVVVGAMLASAGFEAYVNVPGLIIVLGGTAAAVIIKFPARGAFRAFVSGIKGAINDESEPPQTLIRTAAHLANISRNKGPLALEMVTVRNRYYQRGAHYIADGHDLAFVQQTLQAEMSLALERLHLGERLFRAISDSAPAFGMIGTLVGLVQMLSHMSDPSHIGAGMAVALLTTLYGAVLSHLIAEPIADKLQLRAQSEVRNNNLILDSFVQIYERQSPRVVEDMLEPYLIDSLAPNYSRSTSRETKHETV